MSDFKPRGALRVSNWKVYYSIPRFREVRSRNRGGESIIMDDLEKLKNEILQCKKCVDIYPCRWRVVPGTGEKNSILFFIGLAPSRRGSDKTGIPFTRDKSSNAFRDIIKKLGVKYYLTYLVKCTPKKCNIKQKAAGYVTLDGRRLDRLFIDGTCVLTGKKCVGVNRPPRASEIRNCIPYLKKEIELIKPRVIVPLGRITTKVILKMFKIKEKPEKMSKFNCKVFRRGETIVFPMYSPGYAIGKYSSYTLKDFEADFKKLVSLIEML